MNYKNLFYFDIETTSYHSSLDEFKNKDEHGYNLFMRKLERKSENFANWKGDPNLVYLNKTPLMPEYGRIVCVSMAFFKNDEMLLKSIYGRDESKIIFDVCNIFTKISGTGKGLSGYYIKGFDIPWLNRKIMEYGLKIPSILKTFNIKPWEMKIYDLAEIWKNNGTLENTSFDEMLYKLNVKSPKSDIIGKDVGKVYWVENDLERIKRYCESDVIASVDAMRKLDINVF
ncbi:ribonuclease H-like domain-containing protein [Candidatus Woesearchaeota archaeon]|nr:ribonuclease H-like domain-containing protein [Candidatus Woesearchaeota archaeon]MCF7901741.1 ribonuclease H-like domain-containing protein [Candidatus Woesearchaeota archaeon]